MKRVLIGRKEEQEIFRNAFNSKLAEMVAVVGRRRVGKTYLIRRTCEDRMLFEMSGIMNATREEQLWNFMQKLRQYAPDAILPTPPTNWMEAFQMLITVLEKRDKKKKGVVFFDELPWLDTHRSGFLKGLEFFWNSWAENQKIVVVICGSAASWMIRKVINHKGGLHNRVTRRIELKPFTLTETEAYLKSREVFMDHYQQIQLYMVTGGIPHYLKEVKPGKSAIQNMDLMCFTHGGLLVNEFKNLYEALFESAEYHTAIVRALAGKLKGLTRDEILKKSDLPNGGKVSMVLTELEQSGFIASYQPFKKLKKHTLYRLVDEYSLFYLRFIEPNPGTGTHKGQHLSQTAAWRTWTGYAFENICFKHLNQIKKALGISGMFSSASSFYKKGTTGEPGAQIDLVLDRADSIVNIFEIKFLNGEYSMTKDYAKTLRERNWTFLQATKTRKRVSICMITTYGMKHNQHSLGLVENQLDMTCLFDR